MSTYVKAVLFCLSWVSSSFLDKGQRNWNWSLLSTHRTEPLEPLGIGFTILTSFFVVKTIHANKSTISRVKFLKYNYNCTLYGIEPMKWVVNSHRSLVVYFADLADRQLQVNIHGARHWKYDQKMMENWQTIHFMRRLCSQYTKIWDLFPHVFLFHMHFFANLYLLKSFTIFKNPKSVNQIHKTENLFQTFKL